MGRVNYSVSRSYRPCGVRVVNKHGSAVDRVDGKKGEEDGREEWTFPPRLAVPLCKRAWFFRYWIIIAYFMYLRSEIMLEREQEFLIRAKPREIE